MRPIRLALAGASGTGKTTLATWLSETRSIPINPVGSRSVAAAMGFASPYDVDKAGLRSEFQQRLLEEKKTWEADHESFVTDRTTFDNLAYTMLHDVHSITSSNLGRYVAGMSRYTHIVYCPMDVFCKVGGDPQRNDSATYQSLYDAVICGLLQRRSDQRIVVLATADLAVRKRRIEEVLYDTFD